MVKGEGGEEEKKEFLLEKLRDEGSESVEV